MFSLILYGRICFLLLLFSCGTSATRTKDRIYEKINGTASCFRRMNGTHQFGCSCMCPIIIRAIPFIVVTTNRNGNVGVIELVQNDIDLQWLIDSAPLPPYMVVLRMDMFTKPVLISLQNSKKVNGIILLKNSNNSINLAHFTHEDTCPNRYSGFSNFEKQECSELNPWNRDGTSLFLHDWNFPIFFITNETSVRTIIDCHHKYNSDKKDQEYRSLCAMELSSHMFAAKDSETCMRRSVTSNNLHRVKYCDPLGDRNIWTTLFPRAKNESDPERSIIVLSARIDATSMFDGETPGAGSSVAGLVTAMATFQALSTVRDKMEPLAQKRNVLLTLLNGEAYDYIGSSRMIYDMVKGNFPPKATNLPAMNLTSFRLFVELNQVTNLNSTGTRGNLFFHSTPRDNSVQSTDEAGTFINHMQDKSSDVKINMHISQGTKLPPTSLQNFIKADPKLPGVIISDYDDHYVNRFYHSILDNADLLKYTYLNNSEAKEGSIQFHLAGLSTALAKSIFEMVTETNSSDILNVDPILIDELLYCYLISMDCRYFKAASASNIVPPKFPPSMYVGVGQGSSVSQYTGQTLAFFSGTHVNLTKDDCKLNRSDYTYQYYWVRGTPDGQENTSVCIKSNVNFSEAVSPAFKIEDYDWKSGTYSTWTESVWISFSARIFLKPSNRHEAFVLSLGIIIMLLSFPIVWLISSRSDQLFNTNLLNGGS